MKLTPEQTNIILQFVLDHGWDIGKQVYSIFTKDEPTQADWDALWALGARSYDSYLAGAPKP